MTPAMRGSDAARLVRLLEEGGVEVWLDGGWAVDAVLGEETRPHKDLDIILLADDLPALDEILSSRGFARQPGGRPVNFVMTNGEGLEIDVHVVEPDAEGNATYPMEDGSEWIFPAHGFEGRGVIAGTPVRCLSPDVQVACHADGYVPAEKDLRDMARLRARFGVELPQHLDRRTETREQRIQRVLRDEIAIVPYDPVWPERFREERAHLFSCLPRELVRRIEHIGSTAVPGLAAKPIVDMLVEVASLEATKARIVPVLEAQAYDYLWRPTSGDDTPPFYAWFIKRDEGAGARTHHIHMVERTFTGHWDRLLFRDYLIAHPEEAEAYGALKRRLACEHPQDRVAYTEGKSAFIQRVTALAKAQAGAAPRREEPSKHGGPSSAPGA